ncbi:hypothetical protein RFI_35836, partial [Reticulomyxa filosa]
LGAGTADMVCHEITGPFEVREMIASFGGPWGSSYIDQDILTIFGQIFEILRAIEDSKQRFFKVEKKTGVHRIQILFEFDQFMKERIDGLEELVATFEYLGKVEHEYDHEYLSLSCQLWMKLFDLRIDPIIEKMDEILNKNARNIEWKIEVYVQSPYLQYKLKQHYEPKYTFVISQRPILSVIQGAAQLSRIPSFITSRIVKYTYGTGCGRPIGYAQSHPKISRNHINKHKYIRDIDRKGYVGNCFRVFVNKDEEVKVGQVNIFIFIQTSIFMFGYQMLMTFSFFLQMIERNYIRLSKSKKTAYFSICRSEEIDPGVMAGCKCLGKIEVPYPEDFDDVKDELYVRFYFGESMIRVTMAIKGKEYVEKEAQIIYEVSE